MLRRYNQSIFQYKTVSKTTIYFFNLVNKSRKRLVNQPKRHLGFILLPEFYQVLRKVIHVFDESPSIIVFSSLIIEYQLFLT